MNHIICVKIPIQFTRKEDAMRECLSNDACVGLSQQPNSGTFELVRHFNRTEDGGRIFVCENSGMRTYFRLCRVLTWVTIFGLNLL